MKICGTLSSIIIGLTLTACATIQESTMDDESESRDVFSVARAVPERCQEQNKYLCQKLKLNGSS